MKIRHVPSAYTEEQLQLYLDRIRWTGPRPPVTLDGLTRLMRRHLCTIPFTNDFLCYEREIPPIDPQSMFERVVVKKDGFFCFGQNLLFREILRALGFRCYSGAARVNRNHTAGGETVMVGMGHMTVFATLNEDEDVPDETELYLVDVGFGGSCQSVPIPLRPGTVVKGPVDEYHRISFFAFPKAAIGTPGTSHLPSNGTTVALPRLGQEFCLECTTASNLQEAKDKDERQGWRVIYAFSLSEAYADDYSFLHFAHCNLNTFLRDNFIAVIYTEPAGSERSKDAEGGGLGKVTVLNETMRVRDPTGKTIRVVSFESEKERIRSFKEVFGVINVPADAEQVVANRKMAIRSKRLKG